MIQNIPQRSYNIYYFFDDAVISRNQGVIAIAKLSIQVGLF